MKLFSFFAIFQVDSYEILNFESKPPGNRKSLVVTESNFEKSYPMSDFSVYGRWTEWENWETCKIFPIDRSRKFSTRTRTCVCDNCNNYCVGKDTERKICSCAPGYRMSENEWLPCIQNPCSELQPVADGQG